jgi:predicted dinucleotide-binding enzyme
VRVAVVGCGAVGSRAARQLLSTDAVEGVVLVDPVEVRRDLVRARLGERAEVASFDEALGRVDVVILAGPTGTHPDAAAEALAAGRHVVSTADAIDDVRRLSALDGLARAEGRTLAVGAGMAPGLSCVLAAWLARRFDVVDEIHVAKAGTGGPACARQHHRALSHMALDWRDNGWVRRQGGSGRELCWFPEPVGPRDCYRAALSDALVLVEAFPSAERITSRMAATRRDRLTAGLPMLRPPHAEGLDGAVRVELRGRRDGARVVEVVGVAHPPAVAAGAVAAEAALWVAQGRSGPTGAFGLAGRVDPVGFLAGLVQRGVRPAVFDGQSRPGF